MTLPDILADLETLKDYVNDDGKSRLSRLQKAVLELTAPTPAAPPATIPAEPPVALEEEPAPTDRRSEERDPGESEQKEAIKLKLPALK